MKKLTKTSKPATKPSRAGAAARKVKTAGARKSSAAQPDRLEMLEAMIEAIPQGICVIDDTLRLKLANRRFGRLLGLPPQLTKPGAAFADIIRHNAKKGDYGPVDVEARVAERTKALRFSDQYFNVRSLPNGRVLEIHGVRTPSGDRIITYTDVTERHSAERERERMSQILLDAIETIPQGFALFGPDQRIFLCNSFFAESPV